MKNLSVDINRIFQSKLNDFDEIAQQVYQFQREHNLVFKKYLQTINALSSDKFHFFPVEFFKTHRVVSSQHSAQHIFTSSSTSGQGISKHEVTEINIYEKSFAKAFELFYGNPQQYCILALLPNYIERGGSSLVYMAEHLIKQSQHPLSGFYLYDFEKLFDTLIRLKNEKVILLGVTFALLDFASQYSLEMPNLIVMETGGMKGKRKEITRHEVHTILKSAFSVKSIHSEYGMTELLSQAYSTANGFFKCPPWMKIIITDANDIFTELPIGKTGLINVIDLANIYSCSFIQTSDLGRLHADGTFEVLGRLDQSDARGCSLMYL